jgi:hypothetical protein
VQPWRYAAFSEPGEPLAAAACEHVMLPPPEDHGEFVTLAVPLCTKAMSTETTSGGLEQLVHMQVRCRVNSLTMAAPSFAISLRHLTSPQEFLDGICPEDINCSHWAPFHSRPARDPLRSVSGFIPAGAFARIPTAFQ